MSAPTKTESSDPPAAGEAVSQLAEAPSHLDIQAVKDQLAETREEISRVDGKASIVLAGAGVAVGVVIAGLLAGDLQVGKLALVVAVLAGGTAAAALAGIVFLGSAIYPRRGPAEPGRARYFSEVAAYDSQEQLRAALARDTAGGDRLLHQLLGLSKVVASKYDCLRWGIRLLGAAIVLATGAGILDLIVG